jgi:hypothetical protein
VDRAAGVPPHVESLARKLEIWMGTDLVDSERDALRRILVAAASGTDEVQGFGPDATIDEIVRSAYRPPEHESV